MQRLVVVILASAATLLAASPDARALTILRHFTGGAPPPNQAGGGNLAAIFDAAADRWEMAIRDQHTVLLHFGWGEVGCLSGQHMLLVEGGNPLRETEGSILFDNLGYQTGCPSCPCADWYMDPSPQDDDEYGGFLEESGDAGGGPVSVTRMLTSASGGAGGENLDLYSVALHEIGHALGLSVSGTAFFVESGDRDIDVLPPRPFPGTTIPLASNNAGVTSHIDSAVYYGPIMAAVSIASRRFPTALDILANAELSDFQQLDLSAPAPVVLGAGVIPDDMTVALLPGGDITLTWHASCASTDDDYAVYEGSLGGNFRSHQPRACSTGGMTTWTVTPGASNRYFLVVPRNALREGSYGRDSDGVERPPASLACRPQLLNGQCP
jgi:hypothetical protein